MGHKQRNLLLGLLLLGGVGLGLFLHYYNEAFPVASLDFAYSRQEIAQLAEDYLLERGFNLDGFHRAQVFSQRQQQQIFLERTLGLAPTNELARQWLSLWYWEVRWYKPLEKEEYRAEVDPSGRLVGFRHVLAEAAPGDSLAQDRALPLAHRFMVAQGFDLEQYPLIERSTVGRPHRLDHSFTYRRRGFTAGDGGHYRVVVQIAGSQVAAFQQFVQVPKGFSRNYRQVRSQGDLLTLIASLFWIGLGGAMLVVLVQQYRRGRLRWRVGLICGAAVALATLVANINGFAIDSFTYDTTQSYESFWLQWVFAALLGALGGGGLVVLVGTAGEAESRQVLAGGRGWPLGRWSWRRVVGGEFARPALVGYATAGAMLGYVTLFYLLGTQIFGVWAPADVSEYSNAYSTPLPWIYPLLVGLVAATSEEFFFRLLAIPLLLRWTGRRWIALWVPAVVWAFLHSNYPVEPVYTHGLELTVVGLALGWLFLRYGIWSVVVAHYAFNAFMVGYPMLRSSSLYFQVSGILVVGLMGLPAVIALVRLGRRGNLAEEEPEEFLEMEPVEDAVEEEPEPPTAVQVPTGAFPRLTARQRWWILGGISGALALIWGLRTERFGEVHLSLQIDRGQAVERAGAFAHKVGLDLEGYRQVAWFSSRQGADAYTHLVRQVGPGRADSLAASQTAPWMWMVRWFRGGEEEEIRVGVDHRGQIAFFDHRLPESLAGDSLAAAAAQQRAAAFARQHWALALDDSSQFRLLEQRQVERPERLDYVLVWQRLGPQVGEGQFRLSMRVQGSQVGSFQRTYKAPEEFIRTLNETGVGDIGRAVVLAAAVVASLVLAAVYFFRAYRAGELRWGLGLRLGALVVLCEGLGLGGRVAHLFPALRYLSAPGGVHQHAIDQPRPGNFVGGLYGPLDRRPVGRPVSPPVPQRGAAPGLGGPIYRG